MLSSVPYPDEWMTYRPIPEMEGKRLGVFAHVFTNNGDEEAIKTTYRKVVDVAVEEESCLILSGSQSLIRPQHVLLYEEWTDYDEFFQVQLNRPYRNAFMRWMAPFMAEPISPEFTEVVYSSDEHPIQVAYNAYCVLQSIHITTGNEKKVQELAIQFAKSIEVDKHNLVSTVHKSLNNPQHFLLYEVWSDFDQLMSEESQSTRRIEFTDRVSSFLDQKLPAPALEILQIYYDPGRYLPVE